MPVQWSRRRHSINFIRQSKQACSWLTLPTATKTRSRCAMSLRPCRYGAAGFQSVCRAAAAPALSRLLGHLPRRLECVARHGHERAAGGFRCGPPEVTGSFTVPASSRADATTPNPSFEARPNGKPPGPGRWYGVHFHQPGPGVLPSVPPQLER